MTFFNKEADSYDEWYETKFGNFIDTVETNLAFKLFKPEKGMKILDIGCGTGNFSIKLAQKGCKVVGIDISQEMLKKARQKAKKKDLDIEFYEMDVYDLDFQDETFDAIFSMAAFEFIKEPLKALDEIFRVAKDNAQVLIGTINKDSKWGDLYLSEEFQKNTVFRYADFKTLDDLKQLKSDKVVNSGECLFVPPNANEEDITMENEIKLSKNERGGFICVLWKK
ncbi:class I SAM-dependent methyltransferase [Paramaledivibacter caminithermalis]|jgi:ubiquinone biosynthesis O-methyltransferase|uniref:Ubiquinone biosynthesis O-methyltransferase n=1 Tax=Paramaledivibacter caminithermalis (strain DSM 15212 / CIP 107654 / DViRD3) TaxID=1121301 RepID=A0A1M6QYZ8_PARC5|nr:class I SAM-dependent methyltransferase [Paramaledivibacter caminithermalis]SHK25318.1 ubiquinone biosynthesis O-methyltransferase [Paramaledivibacter caminithermalis DSM 15212]